MRLRLVLIGLLLSLSLPLYPALPGTQNAQAAQPAQTGTARVRFANAGIDVPALNVYADGRLWASGITETVGYLDIPAGAHTFTFQLPGGTEPLASVDATLDAGQRVTIAAINTLENLDAIAFVDDVSAPARNAARVRVVNAVPDLGAVRVLLDGETLAANLDYGEVGAPLQILTGVHDIEVMTLDGDPVFAVVGEFFNPERAYTLYLTHDDERPRLMRTDSSVLRPEPATTQLRFAHMAPDHGPLVFYVNRETTSAFGAIDFSSVTPYIITGQGPHVVDVYPAGSTPDTDQPLASVNVSIGAQQQVIFIATEDAGALALTAYLADMSPLPPQTTRLHVIHTATGNPAMRLTTLDDLPLVDRVDPGAIAAREIPAGRYGVRLTDAEADDAALLMERSGLFIPPGTAAALIVFDDDPQLPLVNTVLVTADNVPQQAALRWLHADPQGGAVDVYLDGDALLTDWTMGDSTGHTLLEPRLYALRIYRAGADPDAASPLVAQNLDLRGTVSPRTAVLFGSPDATRLVTLPDSAELLPAERGRVRFIHAVPDVPRIDVQRTETGVTLAQTLTPGTGSVNVNLPPDTYEFAAFSDGAQLAALDPLTVEAGTAYTVVVTARSGSGSALDALVLTAQP